MIRFMPLDLISVNLMVYHYIEKGVIDYTRPRIILMARGDPRDIKYEATGSTRLPVGQVSVKWKKVPVDLVVPVELVFLTVSGMMITIAKVVAHHPVTSISLKLNLPAIDSRRSIDCRNIGIKFVFSYEICM